MAEPRPVGANVPETSPKLQAYYEHLRKAGLEFSPSTVGPDDPVPEPLDLPGVSLSEEIIEMRRALSKPLEVGMPRRPLPPEVVEMYERLRKGGIEVIPSTAGPDDPLPEMIEIPGFSWSEAIIEMRRELDDPER